MPLLAVSDTDLLAENDELKVLCFKLIQIVSSTVKLTLIQKQQVLKSVQLLISSVSSTRRRIAWFEVQISKVQTSFFTTLQIQLEQVNFILLALQAGSTGAINLNQTEITLLMIDIVDFTYLLEGMEQR
jgi:hypothetical protein